MRHRYIARKPVEPGGRDKNRKREENEEGGKMHENSLETFQVLCNINLIFYRLLSVSPRRFAAHIRHPDRSITLAELCLLSR
jgi:hypothetical protein